MIQSDPPCAAIEVDGKLVGHTPTFVLIERIHHFDPIRLVYTPNGRSRIRPRRVGFKIKTHISEDVGDRSLLQTEATVVQILNCFFEIIVIKAIPFFRDSLVFASVSIHSFCESALILCKFGIEKRIVSFVKVVREKLRVPCDR
jgi:hypothetical protein